MESHFDFNCVLLLRWKYRVTPRDLNIDSVNLGMPFAQIGGFQCPLWQRSGERFLSRNSFERKIALWLTWGERKAPKNDSEMETLVQNPVRPYFYEASVPVYNPKSDIKIGASSSPAQNSRANYETVSPTNFAPKRPTVTGEVVYEKRKNGKNRARTAHNSEQFQDTQSAAINNKLRRRRPKSRFTWVLTRKFSTIIPLTTGQIICRVTVQRRLGDFAYSFPFLAWIFFQRN